MQTIYLVVGVPGSGKSWACRQVANKFNYIAHDRCWLHPDKAPSNELDPTWPPGAVSNHLETLIRASHTSDKPILTECPFGERSLLEELQRNNIKVIPVFVIEDPKVVAARYEARERKPLPKNVYTRSTSIKDRAAQWNAVSGTSHEIYRYLSEVPL